MRPNHNLRRWQFLFLFAGVVFLLGSLCWGQRVGETDAFASGRSETKRSQEEGLLCALGGVLPGGLGWDNSFLAGPGAAGASLATRLATIPERGLVVWRFAGDWRAGHEQLSVDDRHQRSPQPDETLWMD